MNYNTDINWDLFFNQVDLIQDDKPILLKNFIPNPEKLVSWKDVENALTNYEARWEIIKDNQKINIPTTFSKWGGEYFDKNFIYNCINEGKTFIIEKYSIQNDYARSICKALENLFPIITDIHVYGSKGKTSSSFPYHFDLPSNFIIQTYGECNWKVYSNRVSLLLSENKKPMNLYPDKLTPIIETTLIPGDVLYIPDKHYHAAFPNQPRLSASIPCYPGTKNRWNKSYYKL
tara:strand:+ start:69 stop:764 length:696 start_codon:yes stop_codon:yes gene_type:complete